MPRYLFNPATGYGTSGNGGGVVPVLLGGTGATTAAGAATNLGFVKTSAVGAANGVASLDASSKLVANMDWNKISSGKPTTLSGYGITNAVGSAMKGVANGVASLDSSGKVPYIQLPSVLNPSITGPTSVYVNQVVNYTINSYSTFTTYTITAVGGTVTRTGNTITFTTTASAGGAASITINGTTFTLTVLVVNTVVAPTITSPSNNATNISLLPSFTDSAFAFTGTSQTQNKIRWEISTTSDFASPIETYEGTSNYSSWTVASSLAVNTIHYVRVKHSGTVTGWSAWSSVIAFTTTAVVSITGPSSLYTGQVANYTIANYNSGSVYTISAVGGTVTRSGATITYTAGTSAGAGSITINSNTTAITLIASTVNTPTITSPANSATNLPLTTGFTSSSFAYTGTAQTQDSVQWDLATNSGFTTIVQTYTGSSNYTSWTPTSLSVNTTYYVRVRYHSSLGGWSAWSTVVSFGTLVSLGWAARLESSYFNGVTSDASNNIIVTGQANNNGYKSYITKWDQYGALTWGYSLEGTSGSIYAAVTDASGNIYAAGSSSPSINLIAKFNSSGTLQWVRSLSGAYLFIDIAIDSSNNLYVINGYGGISKWDTSGNLVWEKKIYNGGYTLYTDSVTCDTSGNIYITGKQLDISLGNLAFIAKLNTSGNLTWQRTIRSGFFNDELPGVTCDASGNIYATGLYKVAEYQYQALITKWDASGNLTWQRRIDDVNGNSRFNSVACDSSGNIYAVGNENDTTGSNNEAFITKWDASGNLTWQRKIGGSGQDHFYGVACDVPGNIYAVGLENSNTGGGSSGAFMAGWAYSVSSQPNIQLTGSGMTSLFVKTTTLTIVTSTGTVGTPAMTLTTPTGTVSTPSITTSSFTSFRHFSTF